MPFQFINSNNVHQNIIATVIALVPTMVHIISMRQKYQTHSFIQTGQPVAPFLQLLPEQRSRM